MENIKIFTKLISTELHLQEHAVENTLKLLDEGCTIPFISRYRKERTGGLDEVQITSISNRLEQLQEIAKRKETIIKTITEQQKMTPELQKRIDDCWESTVLEDIYLPYKPKRRTRAQVAREQGLEPLAQLLLLQREQDPKRAAQRFVRDGLAVADCLKRAQDIIAEQMSEDERSRNQVRSAFRREAFIESKVVKAKKDSDEAQKYSDYFEWEEPLKRCSSHRLLAMRRGESEGILRVSITIDDDEAVERLQRNYVRGNGACQRLVAEAIEDGYKRLLLPSIETEFMNLSKEKADEEAIRVFAENLRQLLLGAPLGQKRVMGIDPGFRTGCKVVCLDAQGNLLHHEAIFPHPPINHRMQATMHLQDMVKKFQIEAIAIGNGTASRETKEFVEDALKEMAQGKPAPTIFVVSEDGASVYSASKVARDEFPDEDVTVRGAVSIGEKHWRGTISARCGPESAEAHPRSDRRELREPGGRQPEYRLATPADLCQRTGTGAGSEYRGLQEGERSLHQSYTAEEGAPTGSCCLSAMCRFPAHPRCQESTGQLGRSPRELPRGRTDGEGPALQCQRPDKRCYQTFTDRHQTVRHR